VVAWGFAQWQAAIADGLRRPDGAGPLPGGIDPDAFAVTLLATLQGGLLLAQVQRDTRPLETALGTLLDLARNSRPDTPRPAEPPASPSAVPGGRGPGPKMAGVLSHGN
jgi:hypothetical protein